MAREVASGIVCFYTFRIGFTFGLWLYNLTLFCYHSLYLPFLSITFSADIFQMSSGSPTNPSPKPFLQLLLQRCKKANNCIIIGVMPFTHILEQIYEVQ